MKDRRDMSPGDLVKMNKAALRNLDVTATTVNPGIVVKKTSEIVWVWWNCAGKERPINIRWLEYV